MWPSRRPPLALRHTLAQAGYGQGEVVVSPVKMARVVAAIARQGRVPQVRWTTGGAPPPAEPQLLSPADATLLARYMRDVVTSGTGQSLAANVTPIAGKTGTAEIDGGRAHSWFAGFAPYGVGPIAPPDCVRRRHRKRRLRCARRGPGCR